jgi:hypothetical protein
MSDHFYLTLPSDTSAAFYPNTIARYVTKLTNSSRRRLRGRLSEIVYPHSWYNVDNKKEKYWIGAFNFRTNEVPAMAIVKSGCYEEQTPYPPV